MFVPFPHRIPFTRLVEAVIKSHQFMGMLPRLGEPSGVEATHEEHCSVHQGSPVCSCFPTDIVVIYYPKGASDEFRISIIP